MSKLLQIALATLISAFPFLSFSQIVINEYSASNRDILADQDGDYEDYIELYNTSGSPVNLGGYYLTDDYNSLMKWSFPASVNINANGFLRIWASSKDEVVGTFIHTNFKLTQTKFEHIALSDPAGIIIDSVTLQLTQKNHSRGRMPNGSSTWGIFTTPTPGTSNNSGYAAYAPRPIMDIPPGFYDYTQGVTITDADPNVTISYTIDGSTPTAASTMYAYPVIVNSPTVIRATAFSSDPAILPSFAETNTYFISVNHDPQYYVISLASTDFDALFNSWGTWDIDAYIQLFGKDHVLESSGEGKVDPHGNDSWAFPQKGIDFEMEDDYGYDHTIDYPLFETKDRDNYDHIILKAGASDNYPFSWGSGGGCHLRDAFVQTLSQKFDLDMDCRTYEPVIIYINGQYWGVYELREKMDEPDYTDHYYNQGENDIDVLAFWGGLNIKYGSDTAWNNLYTFMMTNSLTVPANYAHVDERLNIPGFIDYCIFNTYIVNSDWISWNTMWWRGRNPNGERTKWTYCLWDEDNVFGLGQNYSGWPTTNYTADPCDLQSVFSNAGPAMGSMDMLTKLMLNEDFKSAYINRYADLMNTVLDCDTVQSVLQDFIDILTPEMPGQIGRWGGSTTGWENNLSFLQNFINGRCSYIDSALVDCYDVTGPFDITVIVDPPLFGEVEISTLHPASYPWTGTYFGNVDLNFKATPATNMAFVNWEVANNVVAPNLTSDTVTMNLQAGDTVIAHFENLLPSYNVTVDVTPAASGDVKVQGFLPTAYPYAASYSSGQVVQLSAIPEPGYSFDYWSLDNNFVNPNSTDPNVYFVLATGDDVLAHFKALVGIDDIDVTSLSVYPTLTTDQFHLSYELINAVDLKVRLYSLSGQLVQDLIQEDGSLAQPGLHDLNISMKDKDLTPGMYFLQFDFPGFSKTFKLVLLPRP
ncbi:MAG: CotH kinase family protein [Chitinophagaceae bacterium]|nr:CotH kinase family protein [Chitinophagaceae bacterium]